MIKITETVRDALQGIDRWIPTSSKTAYTQSLLKAGFSIVDCGSFVSPKVVAQMSDTAEVLAHISLPDPAPRIMVLVVNSQGIDKAVSSGKVNMLSFPYSISPTFLKRNLNTDKKQALSLIQELIKKSLPYQFEWVVYLSMGLGNPYGDEWSMQLLMDEIAILYESGLRNLPLSDILGIANPDLIYNVYVTLIDAFPEIDFGLHLHTRPSESQSKIEAAWEAGVRSYETALNGMGGCPTAANELLGNLNTWELISFCNTRNIPHGINETALLEAGELVRSIFNPTKPS